MRNFFSLSAIFVLILMLLACDTANKSDDTNDSDLLFDSGVLSSSTTVAVPTFSLQGASKAAYVKKAATSTVITGPSGSVIHYTLDGSNPTTSSTKKTTTTNSVTISLTTTGGKHAKGGYQIKAASYSGGKYSNVVEERYTIGNSNTITTSFGTGVMLQGFNWMTSIPATKWYVTLKNNATEIKNFNWVWMPPPSDSADTNGYMPRQLFNFANNYGTLAQHQDAINSIKGGTNNTKLVADIVVNHRVGNTSVFDSFTNPVWDKNQIVPQNSWGGAGIGWNDTGAQFSAARDIDHTDPLVQKDILDLLSKLKTLGYSGWRYDYVKGFNGQYVGYYNALSQAEFSVGELWEDGAPQNGLDNWVTATSNGGAKSLIFDFALKNDLNKVFGWYDSKKNVGGTNNLSQLKRTDNTKQTGYVGWKPENCITFIDNHDTGSTQMHWALEGNKVYLAYVYILTQSGIPAVFWDHYFNWNDATNTNRIGNGKNLQNHIKELIKIRRAAGVTNTATVTTQTVSTNLYSAKVGNNLFMKIGTGSWSPSGVTAGVSGWQLYSGNDFAVWYKQ